MRSRSAALVFLLSVLAVSLAAQNPTPTDAERLPVPGAGHDYIGWLNETVSPGTGQVSLHIGIPTPPGRGLNLPFSFNYSSGGQFHLTGSQGRLSWDQSYNWFTKGGWGYGVPGLGILTVDRASWNYNGYPYVSPTYDECAYYTDATFQGLSGAQHPLLLSAAGYAGNGVSGSCSLLGIAAGNFIVSDNEGVHATSGSYCGPNCAYPGTGPVTVTTADGTVYQFPANGSMPSSGGPGDASVSQGAYPTLITDRNGNQIRYSNSTWTDTLGRTLLQWSGFGNNGDTVTIAGYSTPLTLQWTTTNVTFPEAVTAMAGSCSAPGNGTTTVNVVSAITLPNGQSYRFTYDPVFGQLSRITYPSGGYVRYVWGLNTSADAIRTKSWTITFSDGSSALVPECHDRYDVPVVTDRYLSPDGVNETEHQNFVYGTTWSGDYTWQTKTTTVPRTWCAT